MPKALMMLYPGWSEYESGVALGVLREKYQLVTAALTPEPVTGEGGLTCLPHTTLDQVDPADYEVLLLPGCIDLAPCVNEPAYYDFVAHMWANPGLFVAAICAGTYFAARAGLLRGTRYTTPYPPEARRFLGVFDEALLQSDPTVHDGRLLTAKGNAFVEFGLELARCLSIPIQESQFRIRSVS